MSPETVGGVIGPGAGSAAGAGGGAGSGAAAGGAGAGAGAGTGRGVGGLTAGLAQPASRARAMSGRWRRRIAGSLEAIARRLNTGPFRKVDLAGPFPYIRALCCNPGRLSSAPEIGTVKASNSLEAPKTRHRDGKPRGRTGTDPI